MCNCISYTVVLDKLWNGDVKDENSRYYDDVPINSDQIINMFKNTNKMSNTSTVKID